MCVNKLKFKYYEATDYLKSKLPYRWQHKVTWKNFFILLLVGLFVMQYVQMTRVTGGLDSLGSTGSSLIDEVGRLNEVTGSLSGDLNQVRSYLLMPTKDYSLIGSPGAEGGAEDDDPTEMALFRYFGDLSTTERVSKRASLYNGFFGALLQNDLIVPRMGKYNFKFSEIQNEEDATSISLIDLNEEAQPTLLYMYIDKLTGDLFFKTSYEIEKVDAENSEDFFEFYTEYFDDNLEKIQDRLVRIGEARDYIAASFEGEAVLELLRKKRLSFVNEPVAEEFLLRYPINNEAGEAVAAVVLDKSEMEVLLVDLRDSDDIELKVTELGSAIPPFIERLDILPSAQQKIVDAQVMLSQLLEDGGFGLLLEEGGLSVETEARKDAYRLYYDIKRFDGTMIGSIVIEKSTGIIQIVDQNGANAQNILLYESTSKKKL